MTDTDARITIPPLVDACAVPSPRHGKTELCHAAFNPDSNLDPIPGLDDAGLVLVPLGYDNLDERFELEIDFDNGEVIQGFAAGRTYLFDALLADGQRSRMIAPPGLLFAPPLHIDGSKWLFRFRHLCGVGIAIHPHGPF